ncbi:hypothetical protein J3F83DRAFT_658665 [Trichoderma novae-zelandiae]
MRVTYHSNDTGEKARWKGRRRRRRRRRRRKGKKRPKRPKRAKSPDRVALGTNALPTLLPFLFFFSLSLPHPPKCRPGLASRLRSQTGRAGVRKMRIPFRKKKNEVSLSGRPSRDLGRPRGQGFPVTHRIKIQSRQKARESIVEEGKPLRVLFVGNHQTHTRTTASKCQPC